MSWYQHDEPDVSPHCEAVRIGRDGKSAEVTIFYTPEGGFQVHNGYLVEKKSRTNFGRSFDQLKIVTSRGKQILVRRYDDLGEFEIISDGYWLKQKDVEL